MDCGQQQEGTMPYAAAGFGEEGAEPLAINQQDHAANKEKGSLPWVMLQHMSCVSSAVCNGVSGPPNPSQYCAGMDTLQALAKP